MRAGVVYLVGAGPGDPGLMTRRALELVAGADAILHDRLIPAGALAGARADADVRDVGKRPGERSTPQEEINSTLVELARSGRSVVRLKGGDPFVFGRGGEEAETLRRAGVDYEVVPGITAGLAAPAYAGVPATHRDEASAVALVTGHEGPDKGDEALDWDALAAFPGTLVLYMGVARLERTAERLVAGGRRPDEPAMVVERGTLPAQRTASATLEGIAAEAAAAGIRAPAVTVVGPVARMGADLHWIDRRPLHGISVAVTRARAQASGLAGDLRELGAEVVEAPAIRIEPRAVDGALARACEEIGAYALVCVTSPNGAALLMDALGALGRDARALAGVTVAAIGPATAAALSDRGVQADVVPEKAVAEALVEALGGLELSGRRAFVARAAEARDVLPDALGERGAAVEVVALYDTVRETLPEDRLAAVAGADYVTFTSSSTVRNLVAAGVDPAGLEARVVSIGPVTSATAREHGLQVHVEAQRHDIDGLRDALLADVRSR